MQLAAKFRLPIICLIDTPGRVSRASAPRNAARPSSSPQHPGDVAAADADHLRRHRRRGSGGALGIGIGDRVEHAGARLLLGHQPRRLRRHPLEGGDRRDQAAGRRGAEADRQATCTKLGVIDDVIPEPLGGAHRDPREMANTLKAYLLASPPRT